LRSSLAVSGIGSPKILLTTCRGGGVGSVMSDLQCDEDHIAVLIAVHAPVTHSAGCCQPLTTTMIATQTSPSGGCAARVKAKGQISRLDS
jgi:hypothetical protein